MDDKLKSTIDKIVLLTKQNAEFDKELRERLGMSPSISSPVFDDERIDEIYEYCIEKIIRKQAEEFYKDFPLESIKAELVDDFCRMEAFRRKDNFGDFCLSMYQQIENITNTLCADSNLQKIAEHMWLYPEYGKKTKESFFINERFGDKLIKDLLLSNKINSNTGRRYCDEFIEKPISDLYAVDKMKVIVYFIGFNGCMTSWDNTIFREITSMLYNIYQCRNMNHRGNVSRNKVLQDILPLKSFYYFKFIGTLSQYILFIKDGWPKVPQMLEDLQTKDTEES